MTCTSRSVATERRDPSLVAAEGLLHPVAIAAVTLLLVNDHLLKAVLPGVVTGKLSDFAGLVYFPLLLQGVWELAERVRFGRTTRSHAVFVLAAALTVVVFSLVKTVPICAEAYRFGLALLRWPIVAALDLASGAPPRSVGRVSLVCDATDLVALPAALIGWVVMRRKAPSLGGP